MPANIAGVGKDQVQRDRTDFTAGVRGFLHGLCARQVEKRVQGFVIGEVRCLQRQAQTVAQRRAFGAVEQRPVARFVHRFANRPLAFDEIGFVANDNRLPFAADFVGKTVALALDFFQEQVLVVAHDRGHAPRHFAVETAQHHR
ncbi:hypothetical protein D3C84_914330 [compost metagenome]